MPRVRRWGSTSRSAARRTNATSIRELARRFHVHRRDVRAALSSAVPPPRKTPVARPAAVLGPRKRTIDGWLEADRRAQRKQRHTARRVWQRFVEEHDVDVGESTVRRYVAEVRRRQERPLVEVIVLVVRLPRRRRTHRAVRRLRHRQEPSTHRARHGIHGTGAGRDRAPGSGPAGTPWPRRPTSVCRGTPPWGVRDDSTGR
jgi:hypothetical protein